jgi:hypothetical protein
MNEDKWLVDLVHDLRHACTRDQVISVMERLEDQYDAYSGPGQEMMDELLDEARRILRGF